MGEARQSLQYYRLNKAANRDEWLAAMRLQALPSIYQVPRAGEEEPVELAGAHVEGLAEGERFGRQPTGVG